MFLRLSAARLANSTALLYYMRKFSAAKWGKKYMTDKIETKKAAEWVEPKLVSYAMGASDIRTGVEPGTDGSTGFSTSALPTS